MIDTAESLRPPRAGRPRSREEPVGIKSVEQALDVMDALSRSARSRSLTELSADTGMEPSKLHRYLVTLCARGLARRIESSGLYDLGPGALSLGVISLARLDEFGVVRDAADALGTRLRQSTFFYVWSQAGPVLVYSQRPSYALLGLRLGSVVPLVQSATGPIFLAYLPEDMTQPLLERDARDKGLDPGTARHDMDMVCRRIRDERVWWSDTTVLPDSAACAAPIFDAQGDLLCVLGASFYLHGTRKPPQADIIRSVRDVARSASISLGHQDTLGEPRACPD